MLDGSESEVDMGRWVVVMFRDEALARIAVQMVEVLGWSHTLEEVDGGWVVGYWVNGG
jgi:hypothetical protein